MVALLDIAVLDHPYEGTDAAGEPRGYVEFCCMGFFRMSHNWPPSGAPGFAALYSGTLLPNLFTIENKDCLGSTLYLTKVLSPSQSSRCTLFGFGNNS